MSSALITKIHTLATRIGEVVKELGLSKADKVSVTQGTAGTASATSGVSLDVPYVNVNGQGVVSGYGTHSHTVPSMVGATSGAAGSSGIVPAPSAGSQDSFLKGDGTWEAVSLDNSRLATSRSLQTNLASSSAASFDGSADASIGVTGILPVANGGTGASDLGSVTVGAATKAAQDGDGKVISSTYLPLSGGAVTGTLTVGGSSVLTSGYNMKPNWGGKVSISSNTSYTASSNGYIVACTTSTSHPSSGNSCTINGATFSLGYWSYSANIDAAWSYPVAQGSTYQMNGTYASLYFVSVG